MSHRKNIPKALGAAVAMVILILDNRFAIASVAEGLQLCIHTVVPVLFPFFILSTILASSINRMPKVLLRIFQVSPAGGTVLLTGLLGGYPVGAKTLSEAYANGRLSRDEAQRLFPLCNQCGPAFIFGMTPLLFSDIRWGILLWAVQILSVLLSAWMIPTTVTDSKVTESQSVTWTEAMRRAINAMASVCGWIILFRLLIQFLQRWFLWMLPLPYQILVTGLLELTNGCTALNQISSENIRFLICVGIMTFGGLCVTIQSFSVADFRLKRSDYFLGKVLQAGWAITLASILLKTFYPIMGVAIVGIIICGVFFRKKKKAVAFPGKIMYNSTIKSVRGLPCSSEKR